jgi:hypothetical protein
MDRSHVLTAVFKQLSAANTNSIPAYPFEAVILGIICFFLVLINLGNKQNRRAFVFCLSGCFPVVLERVGESE